MSELESFPVARAERKRILVLGLGNYILRDDGVGVHALRCFQRMAPPSCLAIEVGTAVLSAIHLLEQASLVIAFDAIIAGGAPGQVYALDGKDILTAGLDASLHEMGLAWVLKTLKTPPVKVVVIAAEPEIIDYGENLSHSLQSAVPRMAAAALSLVHAWEFAAGNRS